MIQRSRPFLNKITFETKTHILRYIFSESSSSIQLRTKISSSLLRQYSLCQKIRSCLSIQEASQVFKQNFDDIHKYAKTIALQFMNQFTIQFHLIDKGIHFNFYLLVDEFKDLNLYEKGLRLSLWNKLIRLMPLHQQLYVQKHKKYEEEILQALKSDNIHIMDIANLIFIFRVEQSEKLIEEILRQLNNRIDQFYSWQMLHKTWNILSHQINFIPWGINAKNQKLVEFLTCSNEFNVAKLTGRVQTIQIFNRVSGLQLHKVGPKKIPKILNQCIAVLQKQSDKLSIRQKITILEGFYFLPKNYQAAFRTKLRLSIVNTDQKLLSSTFDLLNLKLFSEDQVNFMFKQDKTFMDFFWGYFLSAIDTQYLNIFLSNPRIKRLMKSFIQSIDTQNRDKNFFKIQRNLIKFIYLANYFYKAGELFTFRKAKNIILYFFNELSKPLSLTINGYACLIQFLDANDQKDIPILKLAKMKLNNNTQVIKNKINIQRLNAVIFHINSNNVQVLNIINSSLNFLINQIQPNLINLYKYKIPLLFELLKINQTRPECSYISKIIGDIPNGQQRIVIEHLVLHKQKNQSLIANFISLYLKDRASIMDIVLFVSSLSPKLLTNSKGMIHKGIKHILKIQSKKIQVNQNNLHEVDKFFFNLLNFPSLNSQITDLYINSAIQVADFILDQKWSLISESSRLIMRFMSKFSQVFKQQLNSQQQIILEKFSQIYKKLEKQDHGLYFQIRYLEFMVTYQQLYALNNGLQISKLHDIKAKIQQSKSSDKIAEALLILLKNYCLGRISLSESEALQFYTIIDNNISLGVITSELMEQEIPSQKIIKTLSTQSINNLLKYLRPLVVKAIKQTKSKKSFYVIRNYIIFLNAIKDYDSTKYLSQFLLQQMIYTAQIIFILKELPRNLYDQSFMKLLVHRIKVNQKNWGEQSYQFLYFLQGFYMKTPPQFDQIVQKLYKSTEKTINRIIQKYQTKNKGLKIDVGIILRIVKFLFCAVKLGREDNIVNVSFQMLEEYEDQYGKKIKDENIKRTLHMLMYYWKHQKQNKNKKHMHITKLKLNNLSLFEKYCNSHDIKFEINAKLGHIFVRYYLPQSETIVVFPQQSSKHHLSSQKYYGKIKFQAQIMKKVSKRSVRIFDENTLKQI